MLLVTLRTLDRMRIFAPNETVAKSRFFYFLRQLRKMKAATSEIVAIHAVSIRRASRRGREKHIGRERIAGRGMMEACSKETPSQGWKKGP